MSSKNSVQRPPVVQPNTGNNIIVNPVQRGNPILECVRNVGKEFGEIVVDYQVGRTTGVLFLSLRYHRLHPEYIHQRIEKMGLAFTLRILLLMCDVSEHQDPIRELTKICLINNITILVAWTPEEAGFYLSTLKQFEHKPPDMIKERQDKDYQSMLRTSLTSISKVNKTDVETLQTSLGNIANVAKASSEQLQNLPGFGQVKVRRLKDAFEKPFRNNATTLPQFPSKSQTQTERATSTQRAQNVSSMEPTLSNTGEALVTMSDAAVLVSSIPKAVRAESSGNGAETASEEAPVPSKPPRPPREPSPVWDIELDLNSD
ncbi:ERCC1/RAD10/SWI10 family protein [Abortiporus biennis]